MTCVDSSIDPNIFNKPVPYRVWHTTSLRSIIFLEPVDGVGRALRQLGTEPHHYLPWRDDGVLAAARLAADGFRNPRTVFDQRAGIGLSLRSVPCLTMSVPCHMSKTKRDRGNTRERKKIDNANANGPNLSSVTDVEDAKQNHLLGGLEVEISIP